MNIQNISSVISGDIENQRIFLPALNELFELASSGNHPQIIEKMEPHFTDDNLTLDNRDHFEYLLRAYKARERFIQIDETKQKKIIKLKEWLLNTAWKKEHFYLLFGTSFDFEESYRKKQTLPKIQSLKLLSKKNQHLDVVKKIEHIFTALNVSTDCKEYFALLFWTYHSKQQLLKKPIEQYKILALRDWLIEVTDDNDLEREKFENARFDFEFKNR